MVLRMLLSGTSVPGAMEGTGAAGRAAGAEPPDAAAASARGAPDQDSMSRLMMRPPGPLPATDERSIFFDAAMLRAIGLALTRPPSAEGSPCCCCCCWPDGWPWPWARAGCASALAAGGAAGAGAVFTDDATDADWSPGAALAAAFAPALTGSDAVSPPPAAGVADCAAAASADPVAPPAGFAACGC